MYMCKHVRFNFITRDATKLIAGIQGQEKKKKKKKERNPINKKKS